jgi:hypothetical protein
MTVSEMLRLPWHWHGPFEVRDPFGSVHFELRIRELPDFFVAGTRDGVLAECAEALAAYLQSYVDHQEVPPLPAPPVPTWDVGTVMVAPQTAVPEARPPELVLVPA